MGGVVFNSKARPSLGLGWALQYGTMWVSSSPHLEYKYIQCWSTVFVWNNMTINELFRLCLIIYNKSWTHIQLFMLCFKKVNFELVTTSCSAVIEYAGCTNQKSKIESRGKPVRDCFWEFWKSCEEEERRRWCEVGRLISLNQWNGPDYDSLTRGHLPSHNTRARQLKILEQTNTNLYPL